MEILIQKAEEDNKVAEFFNMRDHYGRSALHYAIFYAIRNLTEDERYFSFMMLIKHKDMLKLDTTDFDGFTPLHLACYRTF